MRSSAKSAENKFAADHVLSHAAGGEHKHATYLAAHGLCNGCRWFYSPEEFRWILRMGVWAGKQIGDQKTTIGEDMLHKFWEHENELPEWFREPRLRPAVHRPRVPPSGRALG